MINETNLNCFNMKNICVFTNTLLKGGAEKQAILLSKALSSHHRVLLIVYYGNFIHEEYNKIIEEFETEVEVILLKGSHFTKFVRLFYLLKNQKINILFSYLLTTNFIGGFIGKLAGVKYTIGGIRSAEIDKNKLFLQRFLHNQINNFTIFNNNQGIVNLSKRGFSSSKSILIPNCFDLKTKSMEHYAQSKISILSVGRFHLAKDYATAIETILSLKKFHFNIEYSIVGYGGLENEIRRLISYNNAEKYIKLVINPDNIDEYYINSDIYLMTSIYEGMSNTLLEAMSYSLPIVATDVGDTKLLIKDNFNGYMSSPGDVQSLMKSLLKLCNSQITRNQFGQNSYKHLKDNFSFIKFKKKYFNFIETLEE